MAKAAKTMGEAAFAMMPGALELAETTFVMMPG